MRIYITQRDHEQLKKNYFHQDYKNFQAAGTCGIIIDDTSWYLYVSLHLTGNEYKLVSTGDPNVKMVEIIGTIPVAANDPHRQPPRGPSIAEVNNIAAKAGTEAIRQSIRDQGILLEEAQMGEIIVKMTQRLDDLMDADGYEYLYNKIGDELGW